MAVSEGKALGAPQFIATALKILRVVRDGSILYLKDTSQSDVFVAGLDPETLWAASAPRQINERYVGKTFRFSNLDWSRDGRSIAYARDPGVAKSGSFVVYSVDTNQEREITPSENVLFTELHFTPDGQALVGIAPSGDRKDVFYRVDVQTGDTRAFFENPDPRVNWTASLSPDGKMLFYASGIQPGGPDGTPVVRLVRRDLQTGEEKEIVRLSGEHGQDPRVMGIAVSPDGQQVAFSYGVAGGRWFAVAPSEGGQARRLLNMPGGLGLVWTRDSRHLLFIQSGNPTFQVYSIAVEGGVPQLVGISMNGLGGLALNPDNTRIAFLDTQSRTDLWAYKNLLPPAPAQ
jgi:Tol biopolymer transport system component